MKKIGLLLPLMIALVITASAQETEKNDPLKWTVGNTTAKLGGFIHVVTAVDFDGAINNEDFIPSYAAVQEKWANDSNFQLTPSYSRLNLEVIQKSEQLGDIKIFFEMDFRGTSNALRLRHAYVTAKGLLIGQTNSLAEDSSASAPSINTQGVNSRSQLRSPQIRYTHKLGDTFSAALSIEKPTALIFTNQLLSIDNLDPEIEELTDYISAASQTAPDLLAAIQSKGKIGHIKLVGIYRTISYHDLTTERVRSVMGYGGGLTGSLNCGERFKLYGQSIYGKGIARYINDLRCILTDLIPAEDTFGRMDAIPMWGASVALSYKISDEWLFSSSISRAEIERKEGYDLDALYKRGDYAAGTLFWSPFKNTTFGVEYLYGSHETMDGSYARANRAQMMVKYSF